MVSVVDWIGRLALVTGVWLTGIWYFWVAFIYDPSILVARNRRKSALLAGVMQLVVALRHAPAGRAGRSARLALLQSAEPAFFALLVMRVLGVDTISGFIDRLIANPTPLIKVPLIIDPTGHLQLVDANLVVMPIRNHLRFSAVAWRTMMAKHAAGGPGRLLVHTGQMTRSTVCALSERGVYSVAGCRLDSMLVAYLELPAR